MSTAIQALIFGPTLSAGGAPGVLVVRATGIEVTVNEQTQRAALTQVQLREIGFGKPGVELAWVTAGEQWAVHVLDPLLAQQVLNLPLLAALPQAQGFKAKQRRQGHGRKLGWTALALLVLSPLLLVLLFLSQANRIAGWITEQIPLAQETQLGRDSFDSMKAQLKLQDSGAAYEAVQSIGQRLTQGSQYSYEFHVVQDAAINAFALPGGIVVVNTGLINATSRPEELAGVLAHEVQHVEQRHSLQGMVKNLGLRAVWALVTGDLGGSLASQTVLQLTSLKFSRDAESAADDKGFDSLVTHGIDPSGMPAFFNTMSKQAADAPATFISTHPLSKDREAELQERVAALPQQQFAKLEMGEWPPR